MMTLRQFSVEHETIPTTTSWYLAELGEARGKQELFIKQSPQKLKVLREHALIESAVSSNRIEGVEVEKSRVHTLIFGKPLLRDRNEEEVRYKYSVLMNVFGRLLREGWIGIDKLQGLDEDKIAKIKMLAGLE